MTRSRLFPLTILVFAGLVYAPRREPAAVVVPATVRVRLFAIERPSEIRVTNADGQTVLMNSRLTTPFRSTGPVTIERKGSEAVRLQYPIEVAPGKAGLVVVNELPFEEYVAAVLAG